MSMISPEAYISQLENCTLEQMITERNSLYRELKRLEKLVLEKDYSNEEWNILPSVETRYDVYLEYVSKMCLLIRDKYREDN